MDIKKHCLKQITIRKYEDVKKNDFEQLKSFCINIGLIQPGDKNYIPVYLLYGLELQKKEKSMITSEELQKFIIDEQKKNKIDIKNCSISNIRRNLKKMKDLYIVEQIKNKYRITEFMPLSEIFEMRIKPLIIDNIVIKIKENLKAYDFNNNIYK